MKKKKIFAKALLTLTAALFSFSGARAQQALPYEYGFENNDLTADGWVLQGATSSSTGINTGAAQNGSYGFSFNYAEQNAYLISPVLAAGEDGVKVSFSYAERSAQYGDEQFQVGYSTDETGDASAFTYGETIVASTDWAVYEEIFPAGTKRIAIKYVYTDAWYLYLDDFKFTAFNGIYEPTGLKVSYEGGTEAIVSWASEEDLFDIDVNGTVTEDVESPYILKGLAYETEYTVKVRAKKDGKVSDWSAPVSFTTDVQFVAPTEVAASNVAATSATISWNGAADSYNLRYGESSLSPYATIILRADDVWGDGSGYQLLLDADANTFGTIFPASGALTSSGNASASVYAEFEYKLPENADGSLTTSNIIVGSSATIEIPAGTYDWVITNPTPNDRVWIASDGGSIGGRKDDYVFEAGKTYEFHVYLDGQNDAVDLTITAASTGEPDEWVTVNGVTSPYTIEGLTPETSYQVEVQAVYADGESAWAGTSFATLTENPVPFNIAADLAADGATLTWEGLGDSYNVQYRAAAYDEPIFEKTFNNLDGWTVYTEGEGTGWTITEYGATAYSWDEETYDAWDADNWLVSPELELGGFVKFTPQTAPSFPDSYEVLLSTTGNAIADFTTTLKPLANAENQAVTIDLSNFAGQTGYIAIHHVSYDAYLIAISDFGIYETVPAGDWQTITTTEPTATISGLATNGLYEYRIQSEKDGNETDWSKTGEFALLTIDSYADNFKLIEQFDGKYAHVTLGRTLYKDNTWNTIVLPFDLDEDQYNASILADGEVRTMSNVLDVADDVVTLNFKTQDETLGGFVGYSYFIGGLPYIVKWNGGSNIENPAFANVTISSPLYYLTASTSDESASVYFAGTYDAISYDADDTSVLFIGADNKLNYPQAGARIGATRGYFELDGINAGEESGVKILTNLDDIDDATGIAGIETTKETGNWYDLSGRKLAGKPAQKGIYVTDGRKVTVK